MWIKKLYATFGKLEGKSLELSPGLNIVYGKNEAGKSTWSAFIKAMFYGISTREREKAGFIPDKEKYLPWSGEAMYGKMELSTDKGDMTIERTSPKSGVFVNTSSTYDENGREAPLGESLIGISANVYERTAFIRQAGIEVSGDKETERRILSIASSGDETISAGEVVSRLKKKQRELRTTTKNGEIQKLEREIEDLEAKIAEAETTEQEIARLSESIAAYKADELRLKRSLRIARAEEEKNKLTYIESAKKSLADALCKSQELESSPARREVDLFVRKKNKLNGIALEDEQNEKSLTLARDELSACRSELLESPFFGMSAEKARAEAEIVSAVLENGQKKAFPTGIFAVMLFALAAAALLGGIIISPILVIVAAFLVGAGIGMLRGGKKNKEKYSATDEIKKKYNVQDVSGLIHEVERFCSLIFREEELLKRESAALSEKSESEEKKKMLWEDLKTQLSAFSIDAGDLDLAEEKLRSLADAREEAQREVLAARARVEALDVAAEVSGEEIEYSADEIPENPPAFIEEELSSIADGIRSFELALAKERVKVDGFSREDSISKLSSLREREESANLEYDALTVAIDVIDEAERELKNRFSPEIEKRTSELFAYLTGGGFQVVRIKNSDFEVDVAKNEASSPHAGLMLSRGTLDELYFVLRIALFETIVPSEEPPPMILDDALVNFDDERCEKALSLLLEIAKERQIILFSCHTREANILRDNAAVRKIQL